MRELKGIVTDIQQVAREAKIVSFNAQVIAARAGLAGVSLAWWPGGCPTCPPTWTAWRAGPGPGRS